MTLSHRLFALSLLVAAAPLPVLAQDTNGQSSGMSLTLKKPSPQAEFVLDGASWYCKDLTCEAAAAPDLPLSTICAHVVRITGAVERFSINGKDLTAAQLSACNARAKA